MQPSTLALSRVQELLSEKGLQKTNKTLIGSLFEYNNNLCTCQAWHPVDSHLEIPLKSWVENYMILRSELLWKWNHLGKNVGEFVMRMGRRSELAGRNRYSWTDHMFTMSSLSAASSVITISKHCSPVMPYGWPFTMCILFKAYVLMNIGSPINFEEKITFLLLCAFGSPNKSVNSDVPYIVAED